jgi:uncharacterized membrane protein
MNQQSISSDITSDDKLWALLSYIIAPIVSIIMLLIEEKKNRPFIKFHAVQSLILGIIAVILYVVLGWIFVGLCLGFLVWAYGIYLGIKAYGGVNVKVPVITDWIIKNNWAKMP